MNVSSRLSIIIPFSSSEVQGRELINQIMILLPEAELILAFVEGHANPENLKSTSLTYSKEGRAEQMNAGGRIASREYVWFLHADSCIDSQICLYLEQFLGGLEGSLYYFDLSFKNSQKLRVQELGAMFRSEVWGIPFGDQGFLLKTADFMKIEGFPEGEEYGEDHLFVWRAKIQGFRLKRIPCELKTSARKYHEQGRLRLTLKYLYLTFKQAIPLFIRSRY